MTEKPHPPLPADEDEARFDDEGSAVGHPEPAETEPAKQEARPKSGDESRMTDQHRQALLDSSANYVEAKLSFADAILAARRAGADDAEIANVTGLTVPMIAAVLRTP